jgi:hypothetical protein
MLQQMNQWGLPLACLAELVSVRRSWTGLIGREKKWTLAAHKMTESSPRAWTADLNMGTVMIGVKEDLVRLKI